MTGPVPRLEVELNGERRAVAPSTTVGAVLATLTSSLVGVAVALNGEVVPRGAWATVVLRPGDRIEVLTVAPGG